ncbi:MAG TPA: tetratricopeptide repeat protein, partial [Chryseolinea sp.]
MKIYRCFLLVVLTLALTQPLFSQNKKFDKSLKKVDSRYNGGSFSKASSSLQSLKKSVVAKMGQQNSYMPGLYIREARITLALGVLDGFEKTLDNALAASLATFGENSTNYAATMIDVAEVYNEYGNFRRSREYTAKAKELLTRTNQLNDHLNARIGLVEGEAMTGQGFCNEALALFKSLESYFAGRAVDKETTVQGGAIKTQRVPDVEIPQRYSDFAKLLTMTANAYSKKGSLLSADSAFGAAQSWIRKNQKYMGETSLAGVTNRYLNAKMLIDHGNEQRNNDLEFDNILGDLKKRANPTTQLAHDLYLAYLHELLVEENRARYLNTKLEYQKMIDKNFPKGSLFQINLKAVEFDSKLERDKTKDLEQDASNLLNSKALPKYYRTREHILNFLFDVAQREKRYVNAENYLTQLADIRKELYGETSPEYHLARIRLASYYLDYTNKIEEAQKIFDESYTKIVAKEIGAWHKDHLDILNHLASLYELNDQYKLALSTLDIASDVARSKYRDTDPDYGIELDRIAQLQIKLGQYEKAEERLTKSLKILEEYRKDDRYIGDYVHAIETQAKLYGIKGLFDEAEANLERSRRLIKNADVPIGSELSSAEELTALFIQLGSYSAANRLLDTQIPEYEHLYGKNSIRLIEPFVNRGRILLANGEYTEAEQIAINANQMALKTYGDLSTKTAPTQKLLSDIYTTLGDYDKAEITISKALASQEKQFGRDHIEVARSLSQLAIIKFHKGDDKKEVEKMMVEARDIIARRLGKDNPQYAEIMKNLAVLYISQKKFDVAFNSLTVAEGIWKAKTGTKNNVNAASIYTLTGDVYYQQKNYKKAEEFYNQSKALYEKFFSVKHPEYVKVLSKLGKVYYMQKDYKRSKRLIEESLSNYENYIKEFFPALSENLKAKYWNTIRGDFEFYNTLAFSNLEDFKDLSGKIYNYQLLTKALLLSTSIKIRERILNSTDDQLKSIYNDWVQKKEVLTLALSMSPQQLTESEVDPGALQQEVEQLEKELSKRSELFGQNFENKRIVFEDVKKSLKANETAIEMVRY